MVAKFSAADVAEGKVLVSKTAELSKSVIEYLQKSLKVGEGCLFNDAIKECKIVVDKKARQATLGSIKRAVGGIADLVVQSVNRKTVVVRLVPAEATKLKAKIAAAEAAAEKAAEATEAVKA